MAKKASNSRSSRRIRKLAVLAVLILAVTVWIYVRTHPYVFNESFWQHAYCIKHVNIELSFYAEQHDGHFPVHDDGYGDALLLLDIGPSASGPGYGTAAFDEAKRDGTDVDESRCGRVYVQGLTKDANPQIAILFDKLATPGGDHCHHIARFFAKPAREVVFVGGHSRLVTEDEWPEFKSRQIELLVKAGIPRAQAESLHAQVGPVNGVDRAN